MKNDLSHSRVDVTVIAAALNVFVAIVELNVAPKGMWEQMPQRLC